MTRPHAVVGGISRVARLAHTVMRCADLRGNQERLGNSRGARISADAPPEDGARGAAPMASDVPQHAAFRRSAGAQGPLLAALPAGAE